MLDTARFELAVPSEAVLGRRVVVVGCGNLGSFTAEFLARMGFSQLRLVDPDTVERANVPTQIYTAADVGALKVEALERRICEIDAEVDIEAIGRPFEARDLEGCAAVVAALDNLPVRHDVWEAADALEMYLVDPRTGLEEWEVHSVLGGTPWSTTFGEHRFPDPTKLEQAPCGMQTIAYTGGAVASVVCALVRRWAVGDAWYGSIWGDWQVPPQTLSVQEAESDGLPIKGSETTAHGDSMGAGAATMDDRGGVPAVEAVGGAVAVVEIQGGPTY